MQARRENGNPVNPDTTIRVSTTLGLLDDEVISTDEDGIATTVLRDDGRIGTAEVIARAGAAESAAVMVMIGRLASSVTLQATPSSVPESGGTINLLAVVRDDQGQPLPAAPSNFVADVGTLDSGGSLLETDNSGQVEDVLRVTEADLLAISEDTFNVAVQVSGTGGALQTDEVDVTVQRPPRASFTFTTSGRTVSFTDTTSGSRPTSWAWDFGDGSATNRQQNPTHTYSMDGDFVVTLTVDNAIAPDPCPTCSASQTVSVRINP